MLTSKHFCNLIYINQNGTEYQKNRYLVAHLLFPRSYGFYIISFNPFCYMKLRIWMFFVINLAFFLKFWAIKAVKIVNNGLYLGKEVILGRNNVARY